MNKIYQKFFDTSVAKQDKIISAAIKEFALYGYENASTNRIVADAGISKGILFHYFGNKQNLFSFIADYCSLILTDEFFEKLSKNESDFFVLLGDMLELRFRLTEFYPHVFLFYDRMCEDDSESALEFIKALKGYTYSEIFKRCDRSVFVSTSDYDRILNYTEWVVNGLIKSINDKSPEEKKTMLGDFIEGYRRVLSAK